MRSKPSALTVIETKSEIRIDSRHIARNLDTRHRNTIDLMVRYADRFAVFGKVAFKTEALPSGQREKYALLNEDQCYFLLSLSRNSKRVVDLKVKLVQAFKEARQAKDLLKTEYLPTYHALHGQIAVMASDPAQERHMHLNMNRLLNRFVGIGSGERAGLALPRRSMLVVAQIVASHALLDSGSCRDGYRRAKEALEPLQAVVTDRSVHGATGRLGAP